jgi:hypothetical protein
MSRSIRLAAAAAILLVPTAASAARMIYSYDSATPVTQKMTENGLTFVFDKHIMSTRVLKLVETQDVGEAEVKPASEHDLGGSTAKLMGSNQAGGHDLYEIVQKGDGVALVRALCPGAVRGFLAIGPLKPDRDLKVYAFGRDAAGAARFCVTLDYNFHGAWALPPVDLPQPDRTDRFNDAPQNRRY